MKKIELIMKPFKLDEVKEALEKLKIRRWAVFEETLSRKFHEANQSDC
jgi:nitrogen regulatory protein PII